MLRLRLHALFTAFLVFADLPELRADLTPGSSAITSQEVQIVVNGTPSTAIPAGETVNIIGLRAATQEAVVSYQPASGPKTIGLLPQASLIQVDAPAAPATNAPAAPAQPAAPATPPAATPVPSATPVVLDLTTILPALDVAKLFKTDKPAAVAQCEGKRFRFTGTIDRLELQSSLSATGEMPILFLKTAPGLPRLKVALSSTMASHEAYFRRYGSYLPGWWWGYSNRTLDYRTAGMGEIQARAVYRSSTSDYKSATPWFTLFKVGEPVSVEASCKGLYMDVTFDGGYLLGRDAK